MQLNVHHDYPRHARLEERADQLAVLFEDLEPDVVVLNEASPLFEIWLAMGAVLAAPVFASMTAKPIGASASAITSGLPSRAMPNFSIAISSRVSPSQA